MSDPVQVPDATASALPAPPPPTADQGMRPHPRPPRPGELSVGWRAITAGAWIGVVLGLAAVWNASVQLGLSTWWLGPRADPQPRYIQFSPFVAPVMMLLATINQMRRLPWIGLVAAAAVAAVGFGDIGRVSSLALVELSIAGAAAAVSLASLTGTYRRSAVELAPEADAAVT